MTKLIAVALILALPALVAADINRFNPTRDLERPDALPRSVQRPEPGLAVMVPVLPVWQGAGTPLATGCQSRVACPSTVPQHVARCLSGPDCHNKASSPVLWPHAPRADEQKTAAKEPRQEQAQVPNNQLAN